MLPGWLSQDLCHCGSEAVISMRHVEDMIFFDLCVVSEFGFHRGYVVVAVRRQYANHCEALSFQHVCVRVWFRVGSHRIHVT